MNDSLSGTDRQSFVASKKPTTPPEGVRSAYPASAGSAPGFLPASPGESFEGGQTPISCPPQIVENPPVLSLGIDSLVLNVRLKLPPRLLEELKNKKELVQKTSEECESVQFGATDLFTWSILRHGAKFYPYILKTGDVILYVSEREHDNPNPPCQLHIGSMSCNDGIDSLLASLKMWLSYYGAEWVTEQVSRIDCYVDIETSMKDSGIENRDHHITRAKKCSVHYDGYKTTGIQVGKSDIVFRAYDKKLELEQKGSTEKQMFFIGKWGKDPEHVTRAEFQLRRPAVKELIPGNTSWNEVKAALPGVWAYLTTWFRHTTEPLSAQRENNNQHLAESSAFWKVVESTLEQWRTMFGEILKTIRNRTKRHADIGPLLDQAAGCMISVAAALGIQPELFAILGTVDKLKDFIATKWENAEYDTRFKTKSLMASISF